MFLLRNKKDISIFRMKKHALSVAMGAQSLHISVLSPLVSKCLNNLMDGSNSTASFCKMSYFHQVFYIHSITCITLKAPADTTATDIILFFWGFFFVIVVAAAAVAFCEGEGGGTYFFRVNKTKHFMGC